MGKQTTNEVVVTDDDYDTYHDDDLEDMELTSKNMEAKPSFPDSVFSFENVSYTVYDKKSKTTKTILDGISATVRSGDVLAIMGPSGAGKSTLINVLTLSAHGGTAYGNVRLDDRPITVSSFRQDCFVVPQHDNHWPYLTCRETLLFAAQLLSATPKDVDDILRKTGLQECADTRVGNEFRQGMSGGQKRRLSVAMALLKKPSLLFLDEPTSGLDAAAASNIMRELKQLARTEGLKMVLTIHQPSSKVYDSGIDHIMLLSKGREAYVGPAKDAAGYFAETQGFVMDQFTNPAEFLLDLVNDDFTSTEEVVAILDHWKSHKESQKSSTDQLATNKNNTKITRHASTSFLQEVAVMFHRHALLILRDPMLYIGRAIMFLLGNLFFAFVYWNARRPEQPQALNGTWVFVWFFGVPSCLGVIAVYALSAEYSAISREFKNGMVRPQAYMFAKGLLALPIMILFAVAALGIPGFVVQQFQFSGFFTLIIFYAAAIYIWECEAEFLSVFFRNPLMGMMNHMLLWFAAFLFGGFLISKDDMEWPLRALYYVMPFRYAFPGMLYTNYIDRDWESCQREQHPLAAICIDFESLGVDDSDRGKLVLESLRTVFGVFGPDDERLRDLGILLLMAVTYKIMYVIYITYHSSQATTIRPPAILKHGAQNTVATTEG